MGRLIIIVLFFNLFYCSMSFARDPFQANCLDANCGIIKLYKLSEIKYCGFIKVIPSQSGSKSAELGLIQLPNEKVYSVKINDSIGSEGGKLIKISADKLTVQVNQHSLTLPLIKRGLNENHANHEKTNVMDDARHLNK